MQPGQTVGGRFVIEHLAGRGGMGSVYRAVDTAAGGAVAVKVLDIAPPGAADRFLREAKVLSRLSHRNIVRRLAQGADGPALWLAMEWLEGRTLAEMLEGGPLPLEAALNVAEQLAAGLAEAHAAGIVHRDVKPSNVVLRAGSADDVRLIDFGIAQLTASTQRLTGTGQFIGTAGYMAPEQIASPNSTDARVDVFALGCVLFESMTGSPAFPGASAVAVMAKILADDPPRPSAVAAHVPSGVDRLIGRMLAKSPEQRPSDMSAILGELRALRSAVLTSEQRGVPPAQMTRREQHLVGVVLVTIPDGGGDMKAAIAAAIAHEARVFRLDDRAYLFVIRRAATADEEAARAAECALAVRAAAPSAHIAVATGLAESDAMMVGPAIDRCNTLLARGTAPGRIALDEATAGLLQGRFEIARSQDGAVLVAPTTSSGSLAPRGDRTPLVGRDKEVRYLEAELDELVDEPAPRAVLLVGDAGSGKSRVLDKLLSRAHARDARSLYARARVVGAGSALALARQLVRHASALPDDAATTALKGALRGRLATTYAEAELPRTLDFLVELCEPGAQADVVPELVAARNEPRMLADWLRRTFVEWLRREASRSLLVVALEDLHWADNASLAWIGEVMRASRDLPLLVVATGRPEVHERVPALRDLLQPQELRLGPLGRKASEQLARALLGVHSTPEAVERVVEPLRGQPLSFEELARRGAIAADASRSWTLVAVLQSRLGQLDPRVRRVLRAASVFGRTFSEDALRELLGDEGDSPLRADLLGAREGGAARVPRAQRPGQRVDLPARSAARRRVRDDPRGRAGARPRPRRSVARAQGPSRAARGRRSPRARGQSERRGRAPAARGRAGPARRQPPGRARAHRARASPRRAGAPGAARGAGGLGARDDARLDRRDRRLQQGPGARPAGHARVVSGRGHPDVREPLERRREHHRPGRSRARGDPLDARALWPVRVLDHDPRRRAGHGGQAGHGATGARARRGRPRRRAARPLVHRVGRGSALARQPAAPRRPRTGGAVRPACGAHRLGAGRSRARRERSVLRRPVLARVRRCTRGHGRGDARAVPRRRRPVHRGLGSAGHRARAPQAGRRRRGALAHRRPLPLERPGRPTSSGHVGGSRRVPAGRPRA
ncbi:MAG: protein kinase [Polyangiaceae bacterium]|nr:protein kinase [Polyangiaceae bacterium]